MWIKICANTNLADCKLAIDAGADALGFIFAESKRRVSAAQVAAITRELPATMEKVGVFTTTDVAEIEATASAANLTAVQLHSAHDAALVARLSQVFADRLKLLQVVTYDVTQAANEHMPGSQDAAFLAELEAAAGNPLVWTVLIDAARAGQSGGLGIAFDWHRVAALIEQANTSRTPLPRIILAGGLTPENVGDAIAILHPFGVDVVSGVEASPGRKDPSRVRAFVRNARAAR